jgi:hypothetical protein
MEVKCLIYILTLILCRNYDCQRTPVSGDQRQNEPRQREAEDENALCAFLDQCSPQSVKMYE